jgi:hypothetical protein
MEMSDQLHRHFHQYNHRHNIYYHY